MKMVFYKKCLVPKCPNNWRSTPNKIFIRVRDSLKENWCKQLKISYNANQRYYCCEDHLNLEEDLENYYYWKMMNGLPILKTTATLKLDTPTMMEPSCSRPLDENQSLSMEQALAAESSELQKLLMDKENLPPKPKRAKHFEERNLKPINTVDKGVQCKPKTEEKSTNYIARKFTTAPTKSTAFSPPTVSLLSSPIISETPSLFGWTSETGSSEFLVSKNTELRKHILDLIHKNPKRYLGIPKQFMWILKYICEQSDEKIKEIDLIITLFKIKLNDSMLSICEQFQYSLSIITAIFRKDCFEIEIQKPSDALRQAQTWSQYKSCNTVKYLIACTPNGFVVFISKGFGGRISDKAILENSNLIDILPFNGVVMADRGFKEVETHLMSKGIKLLRPPSVYSGKKPTKEEVIQTKVIASLRVHVERVIRRIREFAILKPHSVVKYSHIGYMDHIVIIACGLINLQPEIIKNTEYCI